MIEHDWLLVVLAVLATARLTRLVTADDLTAPIRSAVIGDNTVYWRQQLALLLTCAWCISVWIAAAVVTAAVLWPRWSLTVFAVLSASYVAGFLSGHE